MKNKLALSLLIIGWFSTSANSESIEKFASENSAINSNIDVRTILKQQVSIMAFNEATDEGKSGTELFNRKNELLEKNGSDYAVSAIKKFKRFCKGDDMALDITDKPDSDTCKIFLSLK